MNSKPLAIRAAQEMLRVVGRKIKVDGIWGRLSRRAFDSSTPEEQKRVDDAARNFGYGVSDFGYVTDWVGSRELDGYVREAASRTGLSYNLLWSFIELEAEKWKRNGETVYNARSVAPSGLYHGIMQMGAPAWSDVESVKGDIPSFAVGKYNPRWSVIAGAEYALLNQKRLRNYGFTGEFTKEVMYAAHNQGAWGFWKLIQDPRPTNNYLVQSTKAKQVIASAMAQVGVRLA